VIKNSRTWSILTSIPEQGKRYWYCKSLLRIPRGRSQAQREGIHENIHKVFFDRVLRNVIVGVANRIG
jgi:hypothetical protein